MVRVEYYRLDDDFSNLKDFAYDDADVDRLNKMNDEEDVAGITAWLKEHGVAAGNVMTDEEFALKKRWAETKRWLHDELGQNG